MIGALLLIAGVAIAVLAYMSENSEASVTPEVDFSGILSDLPSVIPTPTISGVSIPNDEVPLLFTVADDFRVDPAFLAAIRKTENGGPGREMGILSVSAPTVIEQYTVAARTVSNNLSRYQSETGNTALVDRQRYSDDFVRWFSARYAPIGAANDPTNLNANHAGNLLDNYRRAQATTT